MTNRSYDSRVPSDEILNDPGWQAFHAFRVICHLLGHPEPTSHGHSVGLEVRELTPEQAEEMHAYWAKPHDQRTEEERRRLFTEAECRMLFPDDEA